MLVFGVVGGGHGGGGHGGTNTHLAVIAFSSVFSSPFLAIFFGAQTNGRLCPTRWSAIKTSPPPTHPPTHARIDWYYGPNVTIDHKDQISGLAAVAAAAIVCLYKTLHSTFPRQACVLSLPSQFSPEIKEPQ